MHLDIHAFTHPSQSVSLGETRRISLPTGVLNIAVDRSDLSLDVLCGFAARRNPKRGFLFVSKVLGKHIPVRPSIMRMTYERLAAKIDPDLPGPVVFIGMAETAICLGHGVHEEYCRRTGRKDILFLHSTRYKLSAGTALEFKEEHCHAADQILYVPRREQHADMFLHARSLVMIDDEASTGTTFVNLCSAMRQHCPRIERMTTVVITDWRSQVARASNTEGFSRLGVDHDSVALLDGTYSFEAAPSLALVPMPDSNGNGQLKDHLITSDFGRFGLTADSYAHTAALQGSIRAAVFDVRGASNRSNNPAPTLILGSGEFSYAPFRVAEELEKQGWHNVFVQSTTRSPIMVQGAIGQAMRFGDNYEDGINNFLYNVTPGQYARTVLCTETPAWSVDSDLTGNLRADHVRIG